MNETKEELEKAYNLLYEESKGICEENEQLKKEIIELKKRIVELEDECEKQQEKVNERTATACRLHDGYTSFVEQIEELEKRIKTKDDMIAWLNETIDKQRTKLEAVKLVIRD